MRSSRENGQSQHPHSTSHGTESQVHHWPKELSFRPFFIQCSSRAEHYLVNFQSHHPSISGHGGGASLPPSSQLERPLQGTRPSVKNGHSATAAEPLFILHPSQNVQSRERDRLLRKAIDKGKSVPSHRDRHSYAMNLQTSRLNTSRRRN